MSITVRKRTPDANNPILAIVGTSESDEATARVIKSFLMDDPSATLLVSVSRQADVEEMKTQANASRKQREDSGPELLLEGKALRPGSV